MTSGGGSTRRGAPRLVGVIHLLPLPGSPRSERTAEEVSRAAAEDARILVAAGYDGVIVENFGDTPFLPKVHPVTVSAMTLAALRVRDACRGLTLGINVLRNDAEASLAVAAVVGARFIRVNVHSGARVTDQGVIQGEAGVTLRTRRALDAAGVEIWADVDVKHSAPLGARPIEDEVADVTLRGMADAVLVTGEGTGKAVDRVKLAAARGATSVPLLVASGATEDSLAELAPVCDGVIVGSALRRNGKAGGPVDLERATSFARAFREAFA
jgi:membrane complex biogenesis BtpA family protein